MPPAANQHRVPLRQGRLIAAVLALSTFAVFWPALDCDFVNLDDPDYVTRNSNVKHGLSLEGARWAFTGFAYGNWHPLTWLSLQLDGSLWQKPDGWGLDPRGFHLTNVAFHSASTALLFLALYALTGACWRSAVAAALFGVHPLRVESVAWIAERKDVLSTFFGVLALWAYAAYVRRPSLARYLAVAAAFVLSLLCKPMLVTLPCLLLVLDWWPLQRFGAAREGRPQDPGTIPAESKRARTLAPWSWLRPVVEKIPLLALVALSAMVTFLAQASGGAVQNLERFPLWIRLQNAAIGYVFYLNKTVWPDGLAVFYPHRSYSWGAGLAPAIVGLCAALLVVISAVAWKWRRRAPYLLAGWLWYLGTLVPVIGIVQAGDQSYADRYSYFPQIGILIAACWGVADLASRRPQVALAGAAVAWFVLAGLTLQQLQVWQNSITLWRHDLRIAGNNPLALTDLGIALDDEDKRDEGDEYLKKALELCPTAALTHINRGNLLYRQGKLQESVDEFKKAIELQPYFPEPRAQLGEVLLRQNELDKATEVLQKTIEMAPYLSAGHCNMGLVQIARKDFPRAAECFREALRLQPDSAEAHSGLGMVLQLQGNSEEGLAELRQAVKCNPRYGEAHLYLAVALEQRGDFQGAEHHYEMAVRYSPGLPQGWLGLAKMLRAHGRLDEAIRCSAKARELQGLTAGKR